MPAKIKSIKSVEEIHEISRKLEEEYARKQNSGSNLEERIGVLEGQTADLYKQHKNILEHFREVIEVIKENSVESSEE
jgi:hypothetical protein